MRKKICRIGMTLAYGLLAFYLAGCASAFMKGGALVPAGYQPRKVLVNYRGEGTLPPQVVYQLVLTDRGEAMFEKSPDGSGTLFLLRWEDEKGDHFGGWVARSSGYEFVVPKDRSKNASKYFYYPGTFRYEKAGDGGRLVPTVPVAPVATLIPQ